MNKSLFFLTLILIYSNLIFPQEFTVKYTNSEIIVDGVESENQWAKSNIGSDFWQWRPSDSVRAVKKTEFKALFDEP